MKKSTDGMSNKEKTIFQDMLVRPSNQVINVLMMKTFYDEKKYKQSLKLCENMIERYPTHPGK